MNENIPFLIDTDNKKKYIIKCPQCGEERFVRVLKKNTLKVLCHSCLSKTRYDATKTSRVKGTRRMYQDNCPSCGKELWRPHDSLGKRCHECACKHIRLDRPHKMSSELGYKWAQDIVMYQDKCPKCGKELWRQRNKIGKLCPTCGRRAGKLSGKDNGFWHGGKTIRKDGYIMVKIPNDSPFYPMADRRGYVLEHRLVMAQKIGRCLEKWEIVHHLNSQRNDNRSENLDLLPNTNDNILISRLQERIAELEKRVTLLEAEIALKIALGCG